MELALYCPEIGFYERDACRVGRRGDFSTNVSVGNLFGELLAFQFAEWMHELGDVPVRGVEAGAHDGRLAHDVLTWLHQWRPQLAERLQFWLVEPSSRRQAWQETTLDKFAGQVRWCHTTADLPPDGISGVVFSNELLDAFPVHVLRWDALELRWREWGVGCRGTQFTWERMPTDVCSWEKELRLAGLQVASELSRCLPDGFTVEFSPGAAAWWREAASRLRRGRLVTIDYGGTAEELLSPVRAEGTLRAYTRHRLTADVLANPGEQDITTHVNFTQLRNVGERTGLTTLECTPQARFLTRIMALTQKNSSPFGNWSPKRTRQFQTLTHPEHFGRSFRVLVQAPAG